MGISVQARSRRKGKQGESANLHDFAKVRDACQTFKCKPYSAIVVHRGDIISCELVHLNVLQKIAGGKLTRTLLMSKKALEARRRNKKIYSFELWGFRYKLALAVRASKEESVNLRLSDI